MTTNSDSTPDAHTRLPPDTEIELRETLSGFDDAEITRISGFLSQLSTESETVLSDRGAPELVIPTLEWLYDRIVTRAEALEDFHTTDRYHKYCGGDFETVDAESIVHDIPLLQYQMEAAHDLTMFTVVGQQAIDTLTKRLVLQLFDEQWRDSNNTVNLIERRISPKLREEFLLRVGLIDNGLKSDIHKCRTFRNEIVHNPATRCQLGSIPTHDLQGQLDVYFRALTRLQAALQADEC